MVEINLVWNPIMKRIGILFTFCILSITVCLAQLPHTFTQYTSKDGLAQKTIQGIMQDHKGIMWFATWDGLYMGHRTKRFFQWSGKMGERF